MSGPRHAGAAFLCALDARRLGPHSPSMKSHLLRALGLLMAAIFLIRSLGVARTDAPVTGAQMMYLAGGFIFAAIIFHAGWKDRLSKK